MARVVITRPLPEKGIELLRKHYQVEVLDLAPADRARGEQLVIDHAQNADALVTVLSDPITEAVFEACPQLRVVAQYAVGLDNIDLEAARSRGVVVTHTPGVLTDATADMAFSLLLAVTRRIVEADRYVRDGLFKRWETTLLLGTELKGKTIGIVGMGRIGSAMALRARAFGMQVVYLNRKPVDQELELALQARFVSFDELLDVSDVVSLHCPLTPQTRQLFDARALARLKPTAYLINTARGPVVDETALVEALNAGRLAGAGLDVFEEEPRVHPGLLTFNQVVLAPHLGSATVETRTEMASMCSRSVHAVLTGTEVPFRAV